MFKFSPAGRSPRVAPRAFQDTIPVTPDFDGEAFQPPPNLFRSIPEPVVVYLPDEFGLHAFHALQMAQQIGGAA